MVQEYGYAPPMKATIEVPDDLYRKVKAKSALQGRTVRAVTVELFQQWLDQETVTPGDAPSPSSEGWPENWFRLADEAFKDAPPGPSAREILEHDRGRLD